MFCHLPLRCHPAALSQLPWRLPPHSYTVNMEDDDDELLELVRQTAAPIPTKMSPAQVGTIQHSFA